MTGVKEPVIQLWVSLEFERTCVGSGAELCAGIESPAAETNVSEANNGELFRSADLSIGEALVNEEELSSFPELTNCVSKVSGVDDITGKEKTTSEGDVVVDREINPLGDTDTGKINESSADDDGCGCVVDVGVTEIDIGPLMAGFATDNNVAQEIGVPRDDSIILWTGATVGETVLRASDDSVVLTVGATCDDTVLLIAGVTSGETVL